MASKMENVRILAAMLKAYKIKNVVLSPGNRNLPLVNMLETDEYFNCYSVVDERSAGFLRWGLLNACRSLLQFAVRRVLQFVIIPRQWLRRIIRSCRLLC